MKPINKRCFSDHRTRMVRINALWLRSENTSFSPHVPDK